MPSDESKGSQLDAIGSLAQRQLDNTRYRYRPSRRGASGRLLRHSVQVLRAWHSDFEASSRFVHLRIGP